MSFRKREKTDTIVIHQVEVEPHPNPEMYLWNCEVIPREQGVDGHGVHYLVLPNGGVECPQNMDEIGNVVPFYNTRAVYIRVPMDIGSEPTHEQEVVTDRLIATLQEHYPEAEPVVLFGWDV